MMTRLCLMAPVFALLTAMSGCGGESGPPPQADEPDSSTASEPAAPPLAPEPAASPIASELTPPTSESDGLTLPQPPETAITRGYRVAIAPGGATTPHWQAVHAGARQARLELAGQGIDVELLWQDLSRDGHVGEQIRKVETQMADGVDGLILAPVTTTSARTLAHNASNLNIPTVLVGAAVEGEDWTSFVGADHYRAGEMAGAFVATLLGGDGAVALMRGQEAAVSSPLREAGFLDAITAGGVSVADAVGQAGATASDARQEARQLIASLTSGNGLSVSGIFCSSQNATLGMLQALREAGLAGEVRLVGFGGSDPLVQALRDGEIDGLIVENPMRMGYMAVITLVDALEGRTVDRGHDTGAVLVRPANLDAPEIRALLDPDLEQWLP